MGRYVERLGMETTVHNYAVVAVSYIVTVVAAIGAFLTGLVPSAFVVVVALLAMVFVLGFALGYSVERRHQVAEAIARIRVWATLHHI